MTTRGAAALLAALVLAAGLILGFVPHSLAGEPAIGRVSCGSAFVSSSDAQSTDVGAAMVGLARNYESQCSDALSTPRIFAFSLVGVGMLTLLFCGLTLKGTRRESETPSDQHDHV